MMVDNTELDELEALFEEDAETLDEDLTSNSQESKSLEEKDVGNDFSSIKAEYEKLQKQMLLLQEKMKSKPSESVATCEKDIESSVNSEKVVSQKRSFCNAFSSSTPGVDSVEQETNCKETENVSNNQSKSNPLSTSSSFETFYSTQKKPQISKEIQNKSTNFASRLSHQTTVRSKKAKMPQQQIHYSVERFSGIRLKDRFIDEVEFKQRMDGKLFLKLSLLRPTLNMSEDKDWVTIGVVAKQLDPQTAKNGKKYSIWHLTGLDDCTKHVSLFLFGKIHEDLWRNVTVGTVIGLLNPSIMPPKREDHASGKSYDNSPTLTIDVLERLMKIGVAADLGWCTATKYRNKHPAGKCLAFINKQYGDVCVYHMQSKYKKLSSKRGELQGTSAPGVPSKYKKTLWNKVKGDQFFYGGQVFSAAPPTVLHNQPRKESKMKLTDVFSRSNHHLSNENQKAEMERSKIMQAVSGIEEKQSLTGCSDKFAEMLASGDAVAGSRQFLNHLQKKKRALEEKNKSRNLTAADLLKEQKELKDKKLNNNVENLSASSFLQQHILSMKHNKVTNKSPSLINSQKSSLKIDPNKHCIETSCDNHESQSKSIPHQDNNPHSSSNIGEKLKSPSEIVMQMKRERYMKRSISSSAVSSPAPSSDTPSKSPRLGCGASDCGVDLFGDWLSGRKKPTIHGGVPSLAELRKKKAIEKLRNKSGVVEIKNPNPNRSMIGLVEKVACNTKMKKLVEERVKLNRKDLTLQNKENVERDVSVLSKSKMNDEEFERILSATSSYSSQLDVEEMERQENYFNPLIKKEMMELKMQETFEVGTKVVTCQQCDYTFWVPHERCKRANHKLLWKSVVKKFFECSQCKQRTTTWEPYPLRACKNCGNEKTWRKTSMLKEKEGRGEVLLVRGEEHSKFLNTLKSGNW